MYEEKLSHFLNIEDYKLKLDTFNLNAGENFPGQKIMDCIAVALKIFLEEHKDAKVYWRNQLIGILIDKFADQAYKSLGEDDDNESKIERVQNFQRDYKSEIQRLMERNDHLSVRELLELNEVLLKNYAFVDIWKKQKEMENSTALVLLEERLKEIDTISDQRARWEELFFGVFAGNVFDYGACAVQEIINSSKQQNKSFGLVEALQKVQKRPWLEDSLEDFLNRIENKRFNCVAFFCDNAGVDFVLGVLPFIREFLRYGSKVILCANSHPSLNDITFNELQSIVDLVKETKICNIIGEGLKNKNLVLSETGSSSCCLNFLEINEQLLDLMIECDVDLIAIEGMGRAIHTNLNASFKIESIKLAVIKNKFLAQKLKLGGKLFDVICKYEKTRDI